MLASLLIALSGMGYPILTRYLLTYWIPEKNVDMTIIASCFLLFIYIIRCLLRYFIQYYGHIMGVRMQAKMRSELFDKLQRLPFSYYDNHQTGEILTTITNDLFEVSELAHHGPENILIASFTILTSVLYLIFLNWVLGLILLIVAPLLFLITLYFRKRFSAAMKRTRVLIAQFNANISNSLSGIRVTKAFTNEKLEKEKFDKLNQGYIDVRTSFFSPMSKYFSISQFITDFFNVLVILLGGLLLYLGLDSFKIAEYSTFVVSVSLFITPVNQLIMFIEQLETGVSGFERFLNILKEKEETTYSGSHQLKSINGDLEFSHVSFSYNGTDKVLDDISFKLNKGQILAFVGPSGGGKTSICHLIPRFYFLKENNGNIYIDHKNINDYSLESLRRNIGIVQQDVYLFSGTIKDNLLYGKPDASDEELIAAMKKADIYDYVKALPKGWDTEVGERGSKLSGGQKQRVSIARLFLKNPPLLILDEATSALDNATEMIIQASLNKLAKDRTCIIVAHRLSTIKHANLIAVVEDGKIKEMGSHEQLLRKKGPYRKLYDLQFRLQDYRVKNK